MKGIRKNRKGFTLVELIIVLVILAILIALLVPALTGYIDKANEKKVLAEARGIWTAAQAALSEQYADEDGFKGEDVIFKYNGETCGRVTNNALYSIQNNKWNTDALKEQHKVNIAIGTSVLDYLDSSDKNTATYRFKSNTNPLGQNVTSYEETYGQPGINICYNEQGKLRFIEFGRSGYLARLVFQDGSSTPTVEVKKNGDFSVYPK